LRRRSEKCGAEGSKYAHWIGLYLSFHLSWVLGPFVHGKLQNLKTSEDTFGHGITPLNKRDYGPAVDSGQLNMMIIVLYAYGITTQ